MAGISPHFPFSEMVTVGGRSYPAATVREVLAPHLSERRLARMRAVVAARTVSVVPVMEALSDPGNVNAVLRSAEGLGIAAAHLVALEGDAAPLAESYGRMNADPATDVQMRGRTSEGAGKWMHVEAFPDASAYAEALKARGARLAVTALCEDAVPIDAWDFSQPTALAVGNEHAGVSEALMDAADGVLLLPMDGFVQSYNVSVAAALALYHARADRLRRTGRHADLSEEEQNVLLAHYMARGTTSAKAILSRYG